MLAYVIFLLYFCILTTTDGEADEAGEDAEHADDLFPGVFLVKEEQSIGKTYHRTTAADGAYYRYQTIRIPQCQHIDIVADD